MPKLTDKEVQDRLRATKGWERIPEGIRKTFSRKDFKDAMQLVNKVADLAEEANHHPDILVHGWNKVTFTLMTHSEKGITERDFAVAAKIDRAAGQ